MSDREAFIPASASASVQFASGIDSGTAVGGVTRPAQIPAAMDRLGEAVGALEDRVALLAERLAPVTRASVPVPADPSTSRPPSEGAPLAEGIHVLSGRVDDVLGRVHDLLDRLEL